MAKKPAKPRRAKPAARATSGAGSGGSKSRRPATRSVAGAKRAVADQTTTPARPRSIGPREIAETREVFWQNMMRELLTSLSVIASKRGAKRGTPTTGPQSQDSRAEPPATGASPIGAMAGLDDLGLESDEAGEEADGESTFDVPVTVGKEPGNMFDGRLAVITSLGQRVPIAEVHPVFGCGVPGPNGANPLSMIVECSVFEIRTPGGEVYTLPIHEIKAFHALTPELVEEIGRSAGLEGSGDAEKPFGFAAFTSLARNQGTLSEVPFVEREWQGE